MDEDDYVDCSNQMRGWRRLDEGSNQFGRLPIVFYMEAINSRREPRLIPPHALFYNHFFIYFWTVPGLGPPKTPLMHATHTPLSSFSTGTLKFLHGRNPFSIA